MIAPRKAALFFESDEALADGRSPLALASLHGRPVLFWMARALTSQGADAFFVAAPPRYRDGILDCFPASVSVDVSDRHADLMRFLDAPDLVAVFPRVALPMPQVGVGFAYAAPGRSLREIWSLRMTNAVPDASLLPGWVPLYDENSLRELESLFPASL